MAVFDAERALALADEGRSGEVGPLYRADANYLREDGCVRSFASLVCVALTLVLVVIVADIVAQPLGSGYVDFSVIAILVLATLLGVGLSWYFIARAVAPFRSIGSVKTQILLLTPEGFVARTGTQPRDIFAVSYAEIARITMSTAHTRYESFLYLDLTYRTPQADGLTVRRWRVDPRFGKVDEIAQAIIEGHLRFSLAHQPAAG